MNKEAVLKELNGQMLKVVELYQRKEQLLETVKKAEKEIEELVSIIKNSDGVIQTLQFMIQSEGFTDFSSVQQESRPVELPSHTTINDVSKALKGK